MRKLKKQNSYNPVKENKIISGVSEQQHPQTIKTENTIISSINVGLYGFAIVMSIIILTKLLAFSVGAKEVFELNINDVIFSFWGFLILSFARFVTYYKK
jgi:hypothetical protein